MPTIVCPCVSSTTIAVRQTDRHGIPLLPDGTFREFDNTNFSNAGTVSTGATASLMSSGNVFQRIDYIRRAVLQFDVSEVMVLGTIQSVTLTLGFTGTTGISTINVASALVRGGQTNVESSLTWNNHYTSLTIGQSRTISTGEHMPVAGGHIHSQDISLIFSRDNVQSGLFTMVWLAHNIEGFATRGSRLNANIALRPTLTFVINPRPGVAPINLAPSTTQNPRTDIRLHWRHVPDPAIPQGFVDPQIGSEVRFRHGATGTWITMPGGTANEVVLFPNTIPSATPAIIQFQARTRTEINGWGAWSDITSFPLALDPPLAPTNLVPTAQQNRHRDINVRWRHVSSRFGDQQTDSQIEVWQGTGTRHIFDGGVANQAVIPANTFTTNTAVNVRARTRSELGDWGAWSAHVSFPLFTAPPQAPTNLAPTTSRNPLNLITLTWRHMSSGVQGEPDSQTDSQVEYWQGMGAVTLVSGGVTNRIEIEPNTFTTLANVSFRVRTQGAVNGWGAWSNVATFSLFTAPPQAPTNLTPIATQNPLGFISITWRHISSGIPGEFDTQMDSEVEYWQGTGARTTVSGGVANRIEIEPNTFTTLAIVSFRARTRGTVNGWGAWSAVQTFNLATQPPLAPTRLTPTAIQHRRQAIALSWQHTQNPGVIDQQTDSQVEYWQGTGARTTVSGGVANRVIIDADTFVTDTAVNFRVRTQTTINGWGTWSVQASFPLSTFPPEAPTNLAPTTVHNPRVDIAITWNFNPNTTWFPNNEQTDSQVEVWQGTGTRIVISGGANNRAILPANTFTTLTPINFRARTHTNLGGWGTWSTQSSFSLAISPPLPPTELSPTIAQNPRGIIRVSWLHNPNPEFPDDEQTNSEARFRQGTGAWQTFNGGALNQIELPAFTFATYVQVEFQTRTHTAINGWGEWSTSTQFELRSTPPLAPKLILPVRIAVRAADGVFLEWSYNSPYDIFPSRFDIRYRIGNTAWSELRNDSQGGIPARTNAITRAELMQSSAEWQVRAYGELGDVGAWSDIEQFSIIGIPPTPVIVRVTNSGRPQIHFSAQNAMAWELKILQSDKTVYSTGKKAFEGVFIHTANQFLANGNYLAKLRIANEYGLYSEWATLPFSISITPPEAIVLRTANNIEYHTRLHFNAIGRMGYIYRAELDSDKFIRIAQVDNVDNFEDWTVRPGQRYKYFFRAVGAGFSFADSMIETAISDFKETTIAVADTPYDMIKLLKQLGGNPTRNSDFYQEKSLTKFAGREKPVLQLGMHTEKTINLAFYITLAEYNKLEKLAKSNKVLILRDRQLGVIYGAITDGITVVNNGFSEDCNVRFNFTETDYNQEAKIHV